MVHIEKGQAFEYTPLLVVISPTGDYEDGDLIECAREDDPEKKSYCAFRAAHIAGLE
jgi:hypothetical protein